MARVASVGEWNIEHEIVCIPLPLEPNSKIMTREGEEYFYKSSVRELLVAMLDVSAFSNPNIGFTHAM